MKDEIVSYILDTKNFSPAFLVIEEHVHYMNMCAIEIFIRDLGIDCKNKCIIFTYLRKKMHIFAYFGGGGINAYFCQS